MGDHSVLPVSNDVKKKYSEYCFKKGVKLQHLTDRLLLAEMNKNIPDNEIQVAELINKANTNIAQLDKVKQLMSKVNFYDGYSDSNLEDTLSKMPDADKEYIDLVKRVYALGKKRVTTAKESLREAVEILEQEPAPEGDDAPKFGHPPKPVLGHPPKSAKPLGHPPRFQNVQEPECTHENTTTEMSRGQEILVCKDCGARYLKK